MARQHSVGIYMVGAEANTTMKTVGRLARGGAHGFNPRLEERMKAGPVGMAWAGTSRSGETILVVDDEVAVRSAVREILQPTGYLVLEANRGEEALRICVGHEGPIHLLLTDVGMPVMSGPEVVRRLAHLRPKMRVLYMSGYSDDALSRRGLVGQGTAFLQKPFTPEALAHKVREVLDVPLGGGVSHKARIIQHRRVARRIKHLRPDCASRTAWLMKATQHRGGKAPQRLSLP